MSGRLPDAYIPDVAPWDLPFQEPPGSAFHPSGVPEILRILRERSWLWNDSGPLVKLRLLARVRLVQSVLLPTLFRKLNSQEVFLSGQVLAAYLPGSFPWVHLPRDIDIALILSSDLAFRKMKVSTRDLGRAFLPAVGTLDVELAGISILREAVAGKNLPAAAVLRRKAVCWWGSVFLGGRDLFDGTRPPIQNLRVLADDLAVDARLARWPELAGSPRFGVARKRYWRRREVAALQRWMNRRGFPPMS